MKQHILLFAILLSVIGQAQNVFEFSTSNEVIFKMYSETENKLRKNKDFSLTTPEEIARSYFFATSNQILSSLYLDKEKFAAKDEAHFKKVRNTDANDMYVQLLHKTTYGFQGNEMCYIMFIARVKGVNFPFPTLLDLIKIDGNWKIQRRANQQKISDCLMMFKPCVLSNLIEGESIDKDIKEIIAKTTSKETGLDFDKLFDELVLIQNNEKLSSKLTMSQNLDCSGIEHKTSVKGKNYTTNIYENVRINTFKEQDELLISKIKKNNDSIVLTSKLDLEYSKKQYQLVKYDRIEGNGESIKETVRLDNNIVPEGPAKELLILFENLDTKIFKDLSPTMNETPIMNSALYKESRGVYGVLNISKLYNLFRTNKDLFTNYIY